MEKKLYKILEVTEGDNIDIIKKKYRQLAFKYHPDRNIGKNTDSKFQDISQAYSILSDPIKKKSYDQFGDTYINKQVNFEDISPFKVFDNIFKNNPFFNNENMFCMTGNIEADIKNFTQSFMNLRPLIIIVEFTLEQCYSGDIIKKEIDKNIVISGRLTKKKEIIKIEIPKGILDKERKILKNKGNCDLNGNYGDLIILFKEIPHAQFERQNEHLKFEKKIILSEALSGVEFIFNTIYDAKIVLKSNTDEIIDGNTYHCLEKFGLPLRNNPNTYGNVYIKYSIIFPEYLSKERKKLLLQILPKRKPLPVISQTLVKKNLKKIDTNQITIWEKKETNLKSIFNHTLKSFIGIDTNIEIPSCLQQ